MSFPENLNHVMQFVDVLVYRREYMCQAECRPSGTLLEMKCFPDHPANLDVADSEFLTALFTSMWHDRIARAVTFAPSGISESAQPSTREFAAFLY